MNAEMHDSVHEFKNFSPSKKRALILGLWVKQDSNRKKGYYDLKDKGVYGDSMYMPPTKIGSSQSNFYSLSKKRDIPTIEEIEIILRKIALPGIEVDENVFKKTVEGKLPFIISNGRGIPTGLVGDYKKESRRVVKGRVKNGPNFI